MAITNINPTSGSVLLAGQFFSFDVDNTYTSMVIKYQAASSLETAYDSGAGGVQAGYSVSVDVVGAQHRFTVSRDSGWNTDDVVITVVEDETGASATTAITYSLAGTAVYPEGMQPYNATSVGTLRITDTGVAVSTEVGWIDLVGFTVVDQGNGKVRITGSGASSAASGGIGKFTYNPASAPSNNPTTGQFLTSGSLGNLSSTVDIHYTDADGVGLTETLNAVKVGDLIWFREEGTGEFVSLTVGMVTDNTTHITFSLNTTLDGAAHIWANGVDYNFGFIAVADVVGESAVGGGVGQWHYTFDADTTPESGGFSFDTSGIPELCEFLYLHNTDDKGATQDDFVRRLSAGDALIMRGITDQPNLYNRYVVNGKPTLALSVWTIPIKDGTGGTVDTPGAADTVYIVVERAAWSAGQLGVFEYDSNASASFNPSAGQFLTSGATVALSENLIEIHYTDKDGRAINNLLKEVVAADIIWFRHLKTGEYSNYRVGTPTDSTTFLTLSLNTLLDNPDTHTFVDGDLYAFGFLPVHDTQGSGQPVGGGIGTWGYAGDAVSTPTSGKFSFDTSGIAIASNLYIHQTGLHNGMDMGSIISELQAGDYVYIGSLDAQTVGSWHKVNGNPTETLSVWNVPLDGVGVGSPTSYSLNEECFVALLFRSAAAGGSGTGDYNFGRWTKGANTIGVTAAGQFDVNNATALSVTEIRFNHTDSTPLQHSNWMQQAVDGGGTGTLIFRDVDTPTNAIVYDVTAISAANAPTFYNFTVAYAHQNGTNWDASQYAVIWIPENTVGAGGGGGSGTKTLTTNEIVQVDATEVVIGGGRIDGSTGGTYSWNAVWTYNAGGGTGNRDAYLRLYDDAGVLRSALFLDSSVVGLDTQVYTTLSLTASATPGVDADQILNAADLYEIRLFIDAAGSLDSVTVYSCEFVEA